MRLLMALLSVAILTGIIGCNKNQQAATSSPPMTQLMLDWHPEPEFGGFYAAQVAGNSRSSWHNSWILLNSVLNLAWADRLGVPRLC